MDLPLSHSDSYRAPWADLGVVSLLKQVTNLWVELRERGGSPQSGGFPQNTFRVTCSPLWVMQSMVFWDTGGIGPLRQPSAMASLKSWDK